MDLFSKIHIKITGKYTFFTYLPLASFLHVFTQLSFIFPYLRKLALIKFTRHIFFST